MSVIPEITRLVLDYGERSSTMPPHEILDVMDKISAYGIRLIDEIAEARDAWRAAKDKEKAEAKDYYDTMIMFHKQANMVWESARSRQSMIKMYKSSGL